ncbi:MAG TPA: acyltransferase [Candidatus Acidoferrales bacterium]|nr:acyltransferase [Candidatus Acidoferrales bacterium]
MPKLQRWEIKASTGSHFDVLDGLRGVAILLVVAYHALYSNPADGVLARVAGYIIAAGWMGVPFFFVLSGFLISYPFFKKRQADPQFWYQRGYASRRIAKILPPFYLSILLFIGFYAVQGLDTAYLKSALLWATGLGNFVVVEPLFNGSYWSLIVESHFYLLLPLLFWLTRGRTVRTTTVVLFLILFTVPLVARYFTWPEGLLVSPEYADPLGRYLSMAQARFPCQLDYFAWGAAFAGIYVALGTAREKLGALSMLGYAGGALMLVVLLFWGSWGDQFDIRGHPTRWSVEIAHLLPPVAAMLMLFFVFDPASVGARFFSLSWLRFTGIISYEWFLFHGPVIAWFHEHTGPSHGSVLAYAWRTLVPLALTFAFSALVYRYFSLPILHQVRDRLKKD